MSSSHRTWRVLTITGCSGFGKSERYDSGSRIDRRPARCPHWILRPKRVTVETSRRGTQVVRERSAKPLCVGSIPTRASSNSLQSSESITKKTGALSEAGLCGLPAFRYAAAGKNRVRHGVAEVDAPGVHGAALDIAKATDGTIGVEEGVLWRIELVVAAPDALMVLSRCCALCRLIC